MAKKQIVWFEEVDKEDVGLVGGKGANLGEMLRAGFPVPYGFIVTSHAYFSFIRESNISPKIKELLTGIDYEDSDKLDKIAHQIQRLITSSPIPSSLTKTVIEFYDHLEEKEHKMLKKHTSAFAHIKAPLKATYTPPVVAVRSSATAEDLPTASFAGQQETYLNVRGENHVLMKIRECWASLFTPRAIYYRNNQKFDHFKVGLAAVVQKMINGDSSGIAFSIDPVTNNKSVMTIEAIFGLGEYIVQGKITPDHYEIDKKTLTIVKKEVRRQKTALVKESGRNKEITLTKTHGEREKLSDDLIIKLAQIVKKIEKHYYFPQDIEWAMKDDQLYIVQSRPITTINHLDAVGTGRDLSLQNKRKILVKGDPASPGIASGRPVIIMRPSEIDRVKKGDVLVAPHTNPDYVPAMRRACAIVTETGGRTSHAAIVSRELGVPAVVGASSAIRILRHEKTITVNGKTGEITRGGFFTPGVTQTQEKDERQLTKLHTLTKVYINLGEPEEAKRVANMPVDGVGLLRAEFMIAEMGIHPKEFIKEKKQHLFIHTLTKNLLTFAKAFAPRPIVYRATDFKTNEYRNLKGGSLYEPKEENPLMGYRGATRYISDKQVFELELAALKNVREKGYKNIHLMIPFVRTPHELSQIKNILASFDLVDRPSFKLWIMVEVPSTVILLEDFIAMGIDGISIGTNDLTMLILGVDRDSHEVASLYDERNKAVLWAIERVVKIAKKHHITSSLCGQAASDFPDLVEKLVEWGITSVSVTPDAFAQTKLHVFSAEKKLWQKLKKS